MSNIILRDFHVFIPTLFYIVGVRTCPTITWFQNGVVSVNSYAVGGQAKHACISNQYKLIGAEIRTCKADGVWSGSVPYCVGM